MHSFIKLGVAALGASLVGLAAAAPETYTIDPSHTSPYFGYSHFGFSNQLHRFDRSSGHITIDRAAKTGSVDVTIDATSVNTGFPVFDKHIQSEDFFATAQYPEITFKSSKVNFQGDTPVSVDGQLTVKGVTKPVTLKLTHFTMRPHPMKQRPALGANATAQIKRSDFNMGKYAPNVSDEVDLSIAVEAVSE